MVHCTGIDKLEPILEDRRLRHGADTPHGCWGYPLGNQKLSTYGKVYDWGVQVFFTMTGATINMNNLSLWKSTVPQHCKGFCRTKKKENIHQYVCHEDGCEIKFVRVEVDILMSLLSEEFDRLGYSRSLHATLNLRQSAAVSSALTISLLPRVKNPSEPNWAN